MSTTTTTSMLVRVQLVILAVMIAVKSWDLCPPDTLKCKSGISVKACHCDNICGLLDDCCGDYDLRNWTVISKNNHTGWKPDILLYRRHLDCHTTLQGNHGYKVNTYLPTGDFVYVKTCPESFHGLEVKSLCEDLNSTDIFLNWLVTSRTTKVTYRNIYCSQCWGDVNVFQWKIEYYCNNENETNQNIPTWKGVPENREIKKGFKCKGPRKSAGWPGSDKHPDFVSPPGPNEGNPPGTDNPSMPGTKGKPAPGGDTGPPGSQEGGAPGWYGKKRRSAEGRGIQSDSNPTEYPVETAIMGQYLLAPPKEMYKRRSWSSEKDDTQRRNKRQTGLWKFECKPHFIYPYCENLRPCAALDTFTTCQDRWKGTTVEKVCKQGSFSRMRWTKDGSTYRNIECVVCNGVNPDLPVCSYNLDVVQQPGVYGSAGVPPPLSMIFDPEAGRLVTESRNKRESVPLPTCRPTQVLDIFTYKCRDVSCPTGYELVSQTCTRTTKDGSPTRATCLWVKFKAGEFEVINKTSIILITGHTVPLRSSAVKNVTNTSVLICDKHLPYGWNSTKVTLNYSEGTVVVSILLQSISLICLLVLFIVYLLLPGLRNTPGLTIMSLVVALFYAQFLLLVSGTAAGQRSGCVFIAAAIHFFFLASFCWMCCLALDMALTFSSNLHSVMDKTNITKFIKYSVFAWITPLIIVFLALIMETVDAHPFNPGYGQGFCWITNKHALYLWFLTPMTLLLTATIIMYAITVYQIFQATKASRMVRSEDKLNLFLYIKLAFIMGLTWILAFIWIGTKNIVMEYLFIIFNSLQGAFLFLAFVCRKKVYYMLKRKLSGKKSVPSSSTLSSRLSNSGGLRTRSAAF